MRDETLDKNEQRLCRVLVDYLLFSNFDLYSDTTKQEGGIYTGNLVGGTRDACWSLHQLGILSKERPYHYTPTMCQESLYAWLDEKQFTQTDRDWLLRGMCHLWRWFLTDDVAYGTSPLGLSDEFYRALSTTGFLEGRRWSSAWSKKAIPWLIDSGLADINEMPTVSWEEGARIVSAIPKRKNWKLLSICT